MKEIISRKEGKKERGKEGKKKRRKEGKNMSWYQVWPSSAQLVYACLLWFCDLPSLASFRDFFVTAWQANMKFICGLPNLWFSVLACQAENRWCKPVRIPTSQKNGLHDSSHYLPHLETISYFCRGVILYELWSWY